MREDTIYIYGTHALIEAVRSSPKMIERVFVADKPDRDLAALLQQAGIPVERFDPKTMPRGMDREANHQGHIGRVRITKLVQSYEDFIQTLEVTNDTALVLLGELQDPQNVGAVIRTAAAFGLRGVLIPEHNQAQVTGSVVKVSAGMAFRVPLVSIGNVNNTIKDLKERGFWIYGLDGSAKQSLTKEAFEAPTVFILGNEQNGIREKTLEHCDIGLSIPMSPDCESLNVAASAAVALYAWSTKHPGALKRR
jgi:23S rRNA (guanosine2251-2'-O)-methyltransferase